MLSFKVIPFAFLAVSISAWCADPKELIKMEAAFEQATPEPEYADIAASGDLGYTYGPYTLSFIGADGKKFTRTGRYFTIWKKRKDGSWKVMLDNGLQDDPPKDERK